MSQRTSSASTRSLTKSQIARAPTITEQEIEEMWQRARGTFNYPEFNSGNGGALVGGGKGASGMTANNLKRHVSKTDRVASQRIQKMRELAKQDALIKASMDEEAEQQVNKENEKQKRYIAPAPWEDAPDEQEES